jgi:hypothetical protein
VTGGIVGAILGILLLLGIFAMCFMAYRRRQFRRRAETVDLFAPPPPPPKDPRTMNWNPFAPTETSHGAYSDAGSAFNGRTMSEIAYGQNYTVAQPYMVPPSPSVVSGGIAGVGAGVTTAAAFNSRRNKGVDIAPVPVSRVEESDLPYTRSEYPEYDAPPSSYPASSAPPTTVAGVLHRTGSTSSTRNGGSLHRSGSTSSSRSGRGIAALASINPFSSGPKRRLSSALTPDQLQQVQNLAAGGAPGAVVVDAMESMLRDNYRARTGVTPTEERLPGYAMREP